MQWNVILPQTATKISLTLSDNFGILLQIKYSHESNATAPSGSRHILNVNSSALQIDYTHIYCVGILS